MIMSTASIVLLILGMIFFGISFFIPDGKKEKVKLSLDEKTIKDMVNKEVDANKSRIDEMVDETVSYSVEKAERQLEKISNEKIMAVDEYSETVLKKIDTNHQEAVFLYDMLNKKGDELKNTDAVLQEKTEELKEKDRKLEVKEEVLKARTEDLLQTKEMLAESVFSEEPAKVEGEKNDKEADSLFMPFVLDRVETSDTKASQPKKTRTVKKPITGQKGKVIMPVIQTKTTGEKQDNQTNVELHFDRDNESKKNSNEQIRKMHEEGKSNMAIAKELGLGVGEVKLVIDLYANKDNMIRG